MFKNKMTDYRIKERASDSGQRTCNSKQNPKLFLEPVTEQNRDGDHNGDTLHDSQDYFDPVERSDTLNE